MRVAALRLIVSLTVFVVVLSSLPARAEAPADLSEFVATLAREAIDAGTMVGLSVGVAKGDEVWLAAGYGQANLELQVPASGDSVYRIGSITKQFTAAGILLLMQDGKLNLDDPLTRFLPDYPLQGHTVTIRHLLNHTSGIKSFTDDMVYRLLMFQPVSHKQILARFQDKPFDFEPGAEFRYCNSGYYLLGLVIEEASGQNYEEFLQQRIIEPLELKATFYDRYGRIIPNRVDGYEKVTKSTFQNATYINMRQPFAAGALVSSVRDLLRWQQALVNHRLLDAESWELMTTRAKLDDGTDSDYCLGVARGRLGEHPTIRHGGGINGFRSDLVYFPDEDITIAVLTNTDGADPGGISNKIARHLLQTPDEDAEARP